MISITTSALLSDHVEALIKEARDQAKVLRKCGERGKIETAVVEVSPFRDAKELLLAGGAKV